MFPPFRPRCRRGPGSTGRGEELPEAFHGSRAQIFIPTEITNKWPQLRAKVEFGLYKPPNMRPFSTSRIGFCEWSQAVAKADFLLVAFQAYGVIGEERPARGPPKSMSKRRPRLKRILVACRACRPRLRRPARRAGLERRLRSTSRRRASPSGKTASHWPEVMPAWQGTSANCSLKLPETSGGIAHAAGTKIEHGHLGQQAGLGLAVRRNRRPRP